jgi:hypothetical protein
MISLSKERNHGRPYATSEGEAVAEGLLYPFAMLLRTLHDASSIPAGLFHVTLRLGWKPSGFSSRKEERTHRSRNELREKNVLDKSDC